ncbi:organic cation transporter 1-like [Hyposmocoma kahamanoa]|uniref:organic cation transporter 1-like n=1 Tax=Hyposmocoma kahamanoa TaxID=1477025 RepID=UPI000E6DA132|nr:organic cation transporter 1-like [Hyposmocoma kahamanoa]
MGAGGYRCSDEVQKDLKDHGASGWKEPGSEPGGVAESGVGGEDTLCVNEDAGVYKFDYEGGLFYIGQTQRSICTASTNMYLADVKHVNNSAVCEHVTDKPTHSNNLDKPQVFTNASPEHWCAPPPELDVLQLPDDLLRNLTVPRRPSGTYESCIAYVVDPRALYVALSDYVDERSELVREGGALRMVKISQLMPVSSENERKEQIIKVREAILNIRSAEPVACSNGWKFNTEHYTTTLVTEFSLVCDQEWLPRTGNTLFWVGSIFGNIFFGWMSDRYGRRPTTLLMIFLEVPLAIAASFPSTYWTYIGLRVAGGLFFPALYQQPFILALELMPPNRRTYAGIVVGMLFAAGMCVLALLAYIIRDWFYLSLATSLPFLLLYGYYWIIPESPRWLVGRGRIAEAENVLRNIGRMNGIQLPRGFLLLLHKKIKEEEEAGLLNGHIVSFSDVLEKDESIDRRISNMLTFKPDLTKISEEEQTKGLERILALEVAEIVNKKMRKGSKDSNEESRFNTELHQKSTQTDPLKSPAGSFRRKSLQLVTKMFMKDEDDEENRKMDEQNSEGDGKASLMDIWRYPNIRKKFLLLTFDWVALGVVYNSLSYNSSNLGVDDYLAFFIGGAVELPSYFIAWRCMERFGRRWVLCVFMCVGGLACLCCGFVPESWPWITVSLAMIGRLFAASAFAVFYVLIGELLPTVLRAQAMGAASFISGLGLLACPYIVHLAVYSRALPLIIMGILSILGGITALFFPETLHQPLPQTLGDGELFGRDFKILSCVEKPKRVVIDD